MCVSEGGGGKLRGPVTSSVPYSVKCSMNFEQSTNLECEVFWGGEDTGCHVAKIRPWTETGRTMACMSRTHCSTKAHYCNLAILIVWKTQFSYISNEAIDQWDRKACSSFLYSVIGLDFRLTYMFLGFSFSCDCIMYNYIRMWNMVYM